MQPKLLLPALFLLLALVGCVTVEDESSIGAIVHEDGLRPPRPRPMESPIEPRVLLAATPDGVAISGVGDAPVVTQALAEGHHLVFVSAWLGEDGRAERVTLLSSDEEEQGAQLYSLRAAGSGYGPLEPTLSFERLEGVLAAPFGDVVFQRDLGERWILARTDRKPVPSKTCPVPTSILRVAPDGDGLAVEALARPSETPSLIRARVRPDGISCEVVALTGTGDLGPSVRAVDLGARGRLVIDARGEALAFASLRDTEVSGFVGTLIPALRVESVLPLRYGDRALVLVLSNGEDATPATLSLVELTLEGDAPTLVGATSLTLSASAREASIAEGHALALTAAGLFVADHEGVSRVRLGLDDGELELALEGRLALAGPLFALP